MIINIIKIAGAAILSILLAEILHLDFAMQAGIVAILSIQPTKKSTITTAIHRTISFIAALGIAALTFHTMGFTTQAFLAFLFFYISICVFYHWESSITVNAVIISHFLTFGNMNWPAMKNEIAIFIIGILAGILANIHLKKDVDYIEELKTKADNQIIKILHQMADHILTEDKSDYGYQNFQKLNRVIHHAEHIADQNYENQLRTNDTYDQQYISMRKNQQVSLQEMYKLARQLETTPSTAKMISNFFITVANEFDQDNPAHDLLEQFYQLNQKMSQTPLPKDRKEFEDRALLFALMQKMEEFLQIKANFMKNHINK